MKHIYQGDCPDDDQPHSRDPDCQACMVEEFEDHIKRNIDRTTIVDPEADSMLRFLDQEFVYELCNRRLPLTPLGQLAKTMEELGEVAECLVKPDFSTSIGDELADVLICLLVMSEAHGVNLMERFRFKMDRIIREMP